MHKFGMLTQQKRFVFRFYFLKNFWNLFWFELILRWLWLLRL